MLSRFVDCGMGDKGTPMCPGRGIMFDGVVMGPEMRSEDEEGINLDPMGMGPGCAGG